jgi:hypothetical protein
MSAKGYQVVTTDLAVGTSGKPVTLYTIAITSDGTAGVVILRNGTTTGGTAVVTLTGTASTTVLFSFGCNGVVFPSGLFADVDAHATSSMVVYEMYAV